MYTTTTAHENTPHRIPTINYRKGEGGLGKRQGENVRRYIEDGYWDEAVRRAEGIIDTFCWSVVALGGLYLATVLVRMF